MTGRTSQRPYNNSSPYFSLDQGPAHGVRRETPDKAPSFCEYFLKGN